MAASSEPHSLFLLISDPLRKAITGLCSSAPNGFSESDLQLLDSLSTADRISLQQLRLVQKLIKAQHAGDEVLGTLLQDSKVLAAKKDPEPVSPELEARRKYLKDRQELREYNAMVADVAPNMEPKENFSSYKQQLNVGVNMIVSMAVMYIVCYYAGSGIFREESQKMVCGLAGIVIIILVETALHVVREYEAENYKQPTDIAATFGINAAGVTEASNK